MMKDTAFAVLVAMGTSGLKSRTGISLIVGRWPPDGMKKIAILNVGSAIQV